MLPHSIIVFPERDFVSASGYDAGDRPTVQVVRSGVVIGTAANVVPQGVEGMVEVNHPGGACWDLPVTPDIRAGDVVRVLTALPDTGDATTTADVTVTQPATDAGAGTVQMRGTAVSATGGQIPTDQLEARVIAPNQAFAANGRRALRTDPTGRGEGTLAYDGPGLTTWTATFPNLTQADVNLAVANESRGLWLGVNPGAGAEVTIFEFGATGGPSAPCDAPLAKGPSAPDMTPATDTGASQSDNVTSIASPTFTGVRGLPNANTFTLYVDGVVNGTATADAGGRYVLTPVMALAEGSHTITASETAPGPAGPTETRSTGALAVTIDRLAPGAPGLTGVVPASPGQSSSPSVTGTAEAGSTVSLHTGLSCTSPPVRGAAAAFASAGISAPVGAGSTTSFSATATDVAGNVSACADSAFSYTQDSVGPPAPVLMAAPLGLVASTSATFAFVDSEAGVTFRCAIDGAALTACTSPADYVALGQGAHSFAVHAADVAGNLSGPATASWTVDTVAPTTTITGPVGAEVTVANPTFGFVASEPGSTMRCSLDGVAATVCTTSTVQTSSGLVNGLHRFTVTATDPAGNTGPTATLDFVVRLPAPVVVSPPRVVTPPVVVAKPVVVGAPVVVTRTPAGNATGVSRTGNITARFSKPVTGVSTTSVRLRTKAGKAVAALVTYNRRTRVVTLDPSRTLAADTSYVVTLSTAIKDGARRPLALTRWGFTTGPRPTLTSRTPGVNAVRVSRLANVTATFSEPVAGVSRASVALTTANGTAVAAVVTYNRRTRVATLNPSRTLGAGTTYTVVLTSRIKDAAGNPITAVRWRFSTGPVRR